jgi:prephenate dehydrogenase
VANSIQTIAVCGVGLIGGSFALAARKAGFPGEIVGVSSPETVRDALASGVIDTAESMEKAVARADLIYLSWPILRIEKALPAVAAHLKRGALATDAGSTKSQIVQQALSCFPDGGFLGGHPMAGKESRGVANASETLFAGRTYILTPCSQGRLDTPVASEFLRLLEAMEARILIMDADEHDRVVALTSHLCQLASTALAKTVIDFIPDIRFLAASGRGLEDMTRLADSPYDMWGDIVSTNAANIRLALDQYLACLESLRDNIRSEGLAREFQRGQSFLSALRRSGPPADK